MIFCKLAPIFALLLVKSGVKAQAYNPSILQDTRNEPKVDGTFGFLYRTEDGIAHAAKGDSNGVIQGRFSYTDPTGLKVNYNYNAGSRVSPGYNYNDPGPLPPKFAQSNYPVDNLPEDDGQYREQDYGEQAYNSRQQGPVQPQYQRPLPPSPPVEQPRYYQPRYSSRPPVRQNDIYDDQYYGPPSRRNRY